jgi:hypothetical protein
MKRRSVLTFTGAVDLQVGSVHIRVTNENTESRLSIRDRGINREPSLIFAYHPGQAPFVPAAPLQAPIHPVASAPVVPDPPIELEAPPPPYPQPDFPVQEEEKGEQGLEEKYQDIEWQENVNQQSILSQAIAKFVPCQVCDCHLPPATPPRRSLRIVQQRSLRRLRRRLN